MGLYCTFEHLSNSLRRDAFAALAAGTIIYVVVFEILQREREKNIKPKIVQFLALVAGFATMMTVDLTRKLKMCVCFSVRLNLVSALFLPKILAESFGYSAKM